MFPNYSEKFPFMFNGKMCQLVIQENNWDDDSYYMGAHDLAIKMYTISRNYSFGEPHNYHDADSLMNDLYYEYNANAPQKVLDAYEFLDLRTKVTKFSKLVQCLLPVYKYEHGGVSLSCQPYSCPWDSGQCGIVFVPKKTYRTKVEAERKLMDYVEDYNRYINAQMVDIFVEVYNNENNEWEVDNLLTDDILDYTSLDMAEQNINDLEFIRKSHIDLFKNCRFGQY